VAQANLRQYRDEIDRVNKAGPYSASWEGLSSYRVPQWYEDGKFGIFIHWGVYAVPAFGNEWYPRNMYVQGSTEFEHHRATYGDQAILLEIGRWLRVNGEAIYGTRPWHVYGEGPTAVIEGPFADTKRAMFTEADIRFTTRVAMRESTFKPALYATALAVPEQRIMRIRTLAAGSSHFSSSIERVELLTGVRGGEIALEWTRTEEALEIRLPSELPSEHATSVKIISSET